MGDENTFGNEEPKMSLGQVVDKNFRYLQVAAYGVGCVGIVVIARSIRLTKKFVNMKDIPNDFFKKRVKLYGNINAVKVDGGKSLIVGLNHTPILSFKKQSQAEPMPSYDPSPLEAPRGPLLKFIVPGVVVNEKFVPQIQEKVFFQNIKITLLARCDNPSQAYGFVACRSTGILPFYTDLGKWCLENGFGTVRSREGFRTQLSDPPFNWTSGDKEYYEHLLEKVMKAQRKRLGLWKQDEKLEKKWHLSWWFKILSKFRNK